VAAALLGELVERRKEWGYVSVALVMALSVGTIYLFGVGQMIVVLDLSVWEGLVLGAAPFIAADAFKIVLAIGMASFLLPIRR
jgi:biotin transporter BioY